MAKGDCVRCTHCAVCKHRSSNEQLWIKEHCKLAARDERQHGEWIKKPEISNDYFYCSKCGYAYKHAFNFCPNCGSDNRPRENNSSSMIINGKYSENVEYGTRVEIRKKGGE